MDNCLRDICTGEEETFVYADDVVIITDTLDALQMALNRWREGTLDKGRKINAQKTEVMHVGRDRIEMQVNIGDVRLKQVDTFSYLEVSTNEENKQDIEIDVSSCFIFYNNKNNLFFSSSLGFIYRKYEVPHKFNNFLIFF